MKATKWILCLLLISLPLRAAEVVDRMVAVVGDEIVMQSDLRKYSGSKDPLETLIREKLMKQELDRLQISVSDGETNAAVKEVLTRNNISLDTLKTELQNKDMSFEKYKKDLGDQIRQMKFMGQVIFPRIQISDEELSKKAGGKAEAKIPEEARLKARMEMLQTRAPEELNRYLDEVRAKTYVEIKK